LDLKEYVQVLELLKKIDFLESVSEPELKNILFLLQKQDVSAGKTILFQGEIANRLFIIRKGSVTITTKSKGQRIILAQLNAPMYFGEISLLRPTSATATVTAGDAGAELIVLTHDAMSSISKKLPNIQTRIKAVIDARIASKQKAKEASDAGDDKPNSK